MKDHLKETGGESAPQNMEDGTKAGGEGAAGDAVAKAAAKPAPQDISSRDMEPIIDRVGKQRNIALLFLLGVVFVIGAAFAAWYIRDQVSEPVMLAIAGALAGIGIFFLFLLMMGFIHLSANRRRDEFTRNLVNGMESGIDMGPLAHARRAEAMQVFTEDALKTGARIVVGAPERPAKPGYFWQPTVLTDVSDDARLMSEEVFGPIAPMVRFNDLDAVLAKANGVDFGLAGYAFTGSLKSARIIQDRLKVGMVGINTYGVTAPEMPFAGTKDSGLGVAQGSEGLLDHMNVKSAYRAD